MKLPIKDRWSNIPFKSKLLIGMFLAAAFPIILLSMFSYYVTIGEMREQMDFMALAKAREVQGQVEKVLENIKYSYMETFVSRPITAIMTRDMNYSDYSMQVEAIHQLKGPSYLEGNISGFTFVNFDTDWVLSNRGMYRFSEADNQEEIMELVKKDKTQTAYLVNNIRQNEDKSLERTTINTEGIFMAFELPVPSDTPKCLVIVNISEKSLRDLAENHDGYGVTVLDAEGKLVFSTNKQMDGIRTNQLTSDVNGFTYMISYENRVLWQAGKKIANLSIVLIMVMLLGAGITYLVSLNIPSHITISK